MTTTAPLPARVDPWEAAYARFETPHDEVRKFANRLRKVGADGWPRDAEIVELFCGRGNGLVALQRLGFTRVKGVDLSPNLLALRRGRAPCCIGDCRSLPLRDRSQNVAIVHGGLHHLRRMPEDLERVLAEAYRVLEPNGLFVAVEPWLTPFLRVVHQVGRSALVRRASGKVDALATMIEQEGDTYRTWLQRPAVVRRLLCEPFEPLIMWERWGKLMFVGRKRTSV